MGKTRLVDVRQLSIHDVKFLLTKLILVACPWYCYTFCGMGFVNDAPTRGVQRRWQILRIVPVDNLRFLYCREYSDGLFKSRGASLPWLHARSQAAGGCRWTRVEAPAAAASSVTDAVPLLSQQSKIQSFIVRYGDNLDRSRTTWLNPIRHHKCRCLASRNGNASNSDSVFIYSFIWTEELQSVILDVNQAHWTFTVWYIQFLYYSSFPPHSSLSPPLVFISRSTQVIFFSRSGLQSGVLISGGYSSHHRSSRPLISSNQEGWIGHPLDPIGCLFTTLLDASGVSSSDIGTPHFFRQVWLYF